jgi:hypothetical protein
MAAKLDSLELLAALHSVRAAKNVFSFVLLLALLVQIVLFCMFQWGDVLDRAPAMIELETSLATSQPTSQPIASEQAENWFQLYRIALPAMKFAAVVVGVLLVITAGMAALLSVLGQRGVRGMYSAFFWSLILLALVTPWQSVLNTSLSCGALYNLGDLLSWYKQVRTPPSTAGAWIIYYIRFLGYPALAILVWLAMQCKFIAGGRRLSQSDAPRTSPGEQE